MISTVVIHMETWWKITQWQLRFDNGSSCCSCWSWDEETHELNYLIQPNDVRNPNLMNPAAQHTDDDQLSPPGLSLSSSKSDCLSENIFLLFRWSGLCHDFLLQSPAQLYHVPQIIDTWKLGNCCLDTAPDLQFFTQNCCSFLPSLEAGALSSCVHDCHLHRELMMKQILLMLAEMTLKSSVMRLSSRCLDESAHSWITRLHCVYSTFCKESKTPSRSYSGDPSQMNINIVVGCNKVWSYCCQPLFIFIIITDWGQLAPVTNNYIIILCIPASVCQ